VVVVVGGGGGASVLATVTVVGGDWVVEVIVPDEQLATNTAPAIMMTVGRLMSSPIVVSVSLESYGPGIRNEDVACQQRDRAALDDLVVDLDGETDPKRCR
jgi:hypothetical protein